MTGEYVIQVRDAGTEPGDESAWRASLAFDPVPDENTLAAERMVDDMRTEVTKMNRAAGWYQFRVRYIPEVKS